MAPCIPGGIERGGSLFCALLLLLFFVDEAVAQSAPSYTSISQYIELRTSMTPTEIYQGMWKLGREEGERLRTTSGSQSAIAILHFGCPRIVSGTYGASGYGRFVSVGEIANAVAYYLVGAHAELASQAGNRDGLIVAVGTSNYQVTTTACNGLTREHGAWWGTLVESLNQWIISDPFLAPHFRVWAGSDIELCWSNPGSAFQWVQGYAAARRATSSLLNFGDAAGCIAGTTTCNPGLPSSTCLGNSWDQAQVAVLSWALGLPLPQNYNERGSQAASWREISERFGTAIPGVLTQYEACRQVGFCDPVSGECCGTSNSPESGWSLMWDQINTIQTQPMLWSSDIRHATW